VIAAFLLGFSVASLFGWTKIEATFAGRVLMATSVGVRTFSILVSYIPSRSNHPECCRD
jgi:Kef-type K+ transport system membrane component KefB